MLALTPVGFDTSDKFENHWSTLTTLGGTFMLCTVDQKFGVHCILVLLYTLSWVGSQYSC